MGFRDGNPIGCEALRVVGEGSGGTPGRIHRTNVRLHGVGIRDGNLIRCDALRSVGEGGVATPWHIHRANARSSLL